VAIEVIPAELVAVADPCTPRDERCADSATLLMKQDAEIRSKTAFLLP
jgi:hypothetical protein